MDSNTALPADRDYTQIMGNVQITAIMDFSLMPELIFASHVAQPVQVVLVYIQTIA